MDNHAWTRKRLRFLLLGLAVWMMAMGLIGVIGLNSEREHVIWDVGVLAGGALVAWMYVIWWWRND